MGVKAFVGAFESSAWSDTRLCRDGAGLPFVDTCAEDLPALLRLCAAHEVRVESVNRLAGVLSCDGAPFWEVQVREDADALGVTPAAAAAGLYLTLQGLLSGEVAPAESLTTAIGEAALTWQVVGELGDPCSPLPPAAAAFLRLFEDANPGVVSSPSWDWRLHVLDQAGLLLPALLLTHGEDASGGVSAGLAAALVTASPAAD